jgi:hypothetical protein
MARRTVWTRGVSGGGGSSSSWSAPVWVEFWLCLGYGREGLLNYKLIIIISLSA